jgi:hypothetical protein
MVRGITDNIQKNLLFNIPPVLQSQQLPQGFYLLGFGRLTIPKP